MFCNPYNSAFFKMLNATDPESVTLLFCSFLKNVCTTVELITIFVQLQKKFPLSLVFTDLQLTV